MSAVKILFPISVLGLFLFVPSIAVADLPGHFGTVAAVGDVDEDGFWTRQDVKLLRAMLEVPPGRLPISIDRIDFNRDGVFNHADPWALTQLLATAPRHMLPAPKRTFMYGDLDGDGRVTLADYSVLRAYLEGWLLRLPVPPEAADFNEDGSVGKLDAILLARWLGIRF